MRPLAVSLDKASFVWFFSPWSFITLCTFELYLHSSPILLSPLPIDFNSKLHPTTDFSDHTLRQGTSSFLSYFPVSSERCCFHAFQFLLPPFHQVRSVRLETKISFLLPAFNNALRPTDPQPSGKKECVCWLLQFLNICLHSVTLNSKINLQAFPKPYMKKLLSDEHVTEISS